MAWIKDLGNVKGETGEIYIPKISTTNTGKIRIEWERKANDSTQAPNAVEYPIPVYAPRSYDAETGNATFSVSDEVKQQYGNIFQDYNYHIRGQEGKSIATFNTESFTGSFDEFKINHTLNQYTFYINRDTTEVYIYDGTDGILLEGMKLDNYYDKTETYNQNEIDNMFRDISSQVQLIIRLLDIKNYIDVGDYYFPDIEDDTSSDDDNDNDDNNNNNNDIGTTTQDEGDPTVIEIHTDDDVNQMPINNNGDNGEP